MADTYPDLALELLVCLDVFDPQFPVPNTNAIFLPGGGQVQQEPPHPARETVLRVLRKSLSAMHDNSPEFVPRPWVGSICYKGRERMGIWLDAPLDDFDGHSEYEQIDIVPEGAVWAIKLRKETMDRLLSQAPRRLNRNGQPDPQGELHIIDMVLNFQPPDTVDLNIAGVFSYHGNFPLPDQNFHVRFLDTLSIQHGPDKLINDRRPSCYAQSSVDIDLLTHGLDLGLASVVPFAPIQTEEIIQDNLDSIRLAVARISLGTQPSGDPVHGGAGCLAASLFPVDIPIPSSHNKAQFIFSDIEVTADSIVGSGTIIYIGTRHPAVDIEYDHVVPAPGIPREQLAIPINQGFGRALFTMIPNEDLRPPLTFLWGVAQWYGGGPLIQAQNPNAVSTYIDFAISPEYREGRSPGSIFVVTVEASVTDADGMNVFTVFNVPLILND